MSAATRRKAALACNVVIVVATVIAGIQKFEQSGAGMFTFYTQDSNIFAALISIAFVAAAITGKGRDPSTVRTMRVLRYMATCCLTITFAVSLFVLSPIPESGGLVGMFFTPIRFEMHLLSPALSFISFVWFERPEPSQAPAPSPALAPALSALMLTRRDELITLIPSLIYAAFLYPLNALALVRGPYPFFLVLEMPLWKSVAWFFALIVAFWAIAVGIRTLANRVARRASQPRS